MKFLFSFFILVVLFSPFVRAEEPPKAPVPAAEPAAPAPAPKPKPPAAAISVKAEVNRAVITIGDPVIYTITIKHAPDVQVLSSIPAPEQSILKIKKVEEFKTKEGKMVVEGRKYTLTTFRLGDFILEPVAIQYRTEGGEAQTIETDQIYIAVKSVAEGQTKADIRGLKSILDLPKKVLIFLLLALAIIAALAGFWIYRRFVRKPGEIKPAGPVLTPAEEALFNLNKLFDSDLLPRGKIKDYYLRLSEILRIYFEKRFNILAVEYTTDEILKALREKGIDRQLREKIQEVLENADLAKFAKWQPEPVQILQINKQSKEIVQESKPAESGTPEVPHGV